MKKILQITCIALIGAIALVSGCKADVDMDVHVTKVSLSNSGVNLITGSTFQLSAVVSPKDATNPNISFSSNNEATATVDGEGLITAGTPGTATITVTTEDGGLTDTCTVNVSAAPVYPSGVSIDKTTLTIAIDGTDTLTATVVPADADNKTVRWSSSDTDIVTVSETGELTGIAEGTATVTVTTASKGFTATCDITVLDAFTVSFDTGVGPDIDNQVILDGGTVTQPDDPVQNGYTFDGWYSDSNCTTAFDFTTTITSDTTIYADWDVITYTISDVKFSSSYSGSNAVMGGLPDNYTVESNNIVFSDLSCNGLVFLGWFIDETYTEEVTGIPSGSYGDITVYAKWAKEITVSFDANSGTGSMNDIKGGENTEMILPGSGFTAPSSDLGFAGWATSDAATEAEYTAGASITLGSDNIALYAVWKSMYTYVPYVNGTGIIINGFSDYFDGSVNITLPSTINGETVTAVTFNEAQSSIKSTLKEVTIPESISTLEYRAFYGCNSMETVVFLGSGLTTVKNYGFYYCGSLSSVTLPDSLDSIPYQMFAGCHSLTSIDLPSSIETIGYRAFYNSGLESISISASVTEISIAAFEYCSSLATITVDAANANYKAEDDILFSKDGTAIYQFAQAKPDTSYTVPEGVTTLKQGAFGSTNLTNITLPSTLTTIESSVFSGLDEMTSIVIPEGVTELGGWAFSGCNALETISLPSTLEKFGQSCFTYCYALESITLPASVNYITNYTFWSCDNLTEVIIEAASPPTITSFENVFDNDVTDLVIYVPADSVAAYKAASNWSDGADHIEAIPTP